jgi:2-methylisocitrate lyase-like PEP mutase family enzyme
LTPHRAPNPFRFLKEQKMASSLLRDKLNRGEFIAAPGIQDMITAVIAKDIGFEVAYASGYWLTASAYGLPDAGIATYTQMLDRVGTLARTMPDTAIIADADTGYGGLLNVHHTVRGYEAAGIAAIQIEDQEYPKKCGHTPFKRIVPVEVMVAKIKVAVEARMDPNFLIIARSDARQSEGFDNMMRRLEAYDAAGADVVFPEALVSEEEMRTACKTLNKPVLANMADGGKTPIRSASQLKEIGYSCAIFPAMTSLVAAAAVHNALVQFKKTGTSLNPGVEMYDFNAFCELIGFKEVWDFEKRWAGADVAAE